ncbi:MAG: glycosyltransferase family 2 protein [bacterium]
MIKLAIVVPCFNEDGVVCATAKALDELLRNLEKDGAIDGAGSSVTFVDDGSEDGTWSQIEEIVRTNPWFHGVRLSRNVGHQFALLAGLSHVSGDAVVTIDADLQDDLGVVKEMVALYQSGAQIVCGVRVGRGTDSWFKQWSAKTFYKLLATLGVRVVYNHADFRLMGRPAVDALKQYKEVNLFLRGIIPTLGFRTAVVYYDRRARVAGVSKYPLRKMVQLAWDGVTSFSTIPLRLITITGCLVSLFSFAVGCWAVWVRVFNPGAVPGWASTVIPMYFLGGVQLLSLGIMGEYISKIYFEAKGRPRYIIDRVI